MRALGARPRSTRAAGCQSLVSNAPGPRGRHAGRRLQAPVVCQAAAAAALQMRSPVYTQPAPQQPAAPSPPATLACELIQGNLARFSDKSRASNVPTAVLVHGILGSRRNLQSFARMIVEGFPAWQVLLVDLRCHGDSAAAAGGAPAPGPHSVDTAARDVLELLRGRRMFPQMLIGHSFGGKVVMSMARQFGGGPGAALPRPVQVWVLDALPGEARAGGGPDGVADHPRQLIAALQALPVPLAGRNELIDELTRRGFSLPIARWMTTNLRPGEGPHGGVTWSFDLDGIADMYRSYEDTCLWDLLRAPPQGLKVDFVRATRSTFRWEGGAAEQIAALGHGVHPLDAGHWVHTDNRVGGLFDILAPTFGAVDLHMQHAARASAR